MITKYEVLNPITKRNKPYYNTKGLLVVPNVFSKHYKWYVEVARTNPITADRNYFILFSTERFDDNCIKVSKDSSKRPCIELHRELKDYVDREIHARGNVELEYIESETEYDVWELY